MNRWKWRQERVTDTAGSYQTKITHGFGAGWNPTVN
jgi:hypothetical protein